MSTIFVTGASGFVGSHLVPALVDAGHRVVGLVRNEAGAAEVRRRLTSGQAAAVETRTGDVTKRETLSSALRGVDAILHLVALPRDWDKGQSLRLVNTEGTRNLLGAVQEAGIRRFVHLGALGVVDLPELHYGSTKAKAVALVKASGLDWTVLSPSVMYGDRDGFFNILGDLVRMSPGIVPITGSGQARFQPLAVSDLARAAVIAFGDDDAGRATVGREFPLGGPRYWTYREMMGEVLRGMGRKRTLIPLPVAVIRLVAATAEFVRVPFPVATDQLRQLRFDNVGPLDAVRSGLGFDPQPMEGNLTHLRRTVRDQEPDAA